MDAYNMGAFRKPAQEKSQSQMSMCVLDDSIIYSINNSKLAYGDKNQTSGWLPRVEVFDYKEM